MARRLTILAALVSIRRTSAIAGRQKALQLGWKLVLQPNEARHSEFLEASRSDLFAEAGLYFLATQLTFEPVTAIAFPSTTPTNSLPLFTTTKCIGIGPLNTADPVQSGLTA